jgi:hypothetical protein
MNMEEGITLGVMLVSGVWLIAAVGTGAHYVGTTLGGPVGSYAYYGLLFIGALCIWLFMRRVIRDKGCPE